MYKFNNLNDGSSSIIRNFDGAIIPINIGNVDYCNFLEEYIKTGPSVFTEGTPNEQFESDVFTVRLRNYRIAMKRLAKYELSVGQPEVIEQRFLGKRAKNEETGEWEDVLESAISKHKIDPLPEFLDQEVFNPETREVTVTQVRNPAIVKDELERAAAQAVVDSTPQEVKDAL